MSQSTIFRAATIIDGTEDPEPYVADVLISDGVIAKIGQGLDAPEECREVEAKGHVLCPGFIDMHAHSDLYLLTHPAHVAKISQGCTVCPCRLPGVDRGAPAS
jgi:N-acyl-D-amino-acid deacylase